MVYFLRAPGRIQSAERDFPALAFTNAYYEPSDPPCGRGHIGGRTMSNLDFSKPGEAGELPVDFTPWKWAVAYTVRPEVMSPLVCGEEYRIGATVVRSRPADASFRGYEDLYSHADTLVRARAARL